LDRLGGKFGSSSTAELTTVELTFSVADVVEAFALVERWLLEPPHPDDVGRAQAFVRAETAVLPDTAVQALGHALRLLSAGRHFAARTDPERLESSPLALAARQHGLLRLGWVTAAVGPGEPPWPSGGSATRPRWRPVAPPPAGSVAELVEFGTGGARSTVCGARCLAGLGTTLDPGELAAAVLDYGQELEPQQRLSAMAGAAKPVLHHRRYGALGFLAIVVRGRPGADILVAEAVGDVFGALADTAPDQARRRLVHHLELLIDTPRRRAAEEGLCALYGAPGPAERLDHARSCPSEEIRRALRLVAGAPAVSVTVRR
jgi:hypothetical protein